MIIYKTLKEYIDSERKRMNNDDAKSLSYKSEQYLVYPEQQGEEDKPINPYGQH